MRSSPRPPSCKIQPIVLTPTESETIRKAAAPLVTFHLHWKFRFSFSKLWKCSGHHKQFSKISCLWLLWVRGTFSSVVLTFLFFRKNDQAFHCLLHFYQSPTLLCDPNAGAGTRVIPSRMPPVVVGSAGLLFCLLAVLNSWIALVLEDLKSTDIVIVTRFCRWGNSGMTCSILLGRTIAADTRLLSPKSRSGV